MFKITGLDNVMKQLTDLQKKAEAMSKQSVPVTEVLTHSFLMSHTPFGSADEMYEASGFKNRNRRGFRGSSRRRMGCLYPIRIALHGLAVHAQRSWKRMGDQTTWLEMTETNITTSAALTLAFQDMDDATTDFKQAELKDAARVLNRLVMVFDREPLASFLSETLPPVDFADWLKRAGATAGSFVGSAALPWSDDRAERVSMKVALCRSIAARKVVCRGAGNR